MALPWAALQTTVPAVVQNFVALTVLEYSVGLSVVTRKADATI